MGFGLHGFWVSGFQGFKGCKGSGKGSCKGSIPVLLY